MTDYAIQVENLSKRYRIGKPAAQRTGLKKVLNPLASPFQYLFSTMRQAAPDEILWALRDVSFNVSQGEVIGVIGRNGAGKSTLLKILSRITDPTSGRALIKGRVGSLLEVGTGFHPELTGRENIYLSGAILGMKRDEIARKFDEMVAFAEIERFIDTPVKRYSSGMYVRLAFAVAAHLEPEVLLVDEVLAVGDAAFQKKCLGKMGDVAKEGRTILFVSHNMIAVQNLCDRSVWLQDGQIIQQGPTSEVVSEYLSRSFKPVTEQTWENIDAAPGNDKVRIHSLRIRSEHGFVTDIITTKSPIQVEIKYWNLVPGSTLHISLHFYNEQQIVAFTTGSHEGDLLAKERSLEVGLYRSICQVPMNLLNEGPHSIMLLVIQNTSKIAYRMEDALTFDVIDTSPRLGTWYGKEPGVVRPLLSWQTEYVEGIYGRQ